MILCSYTGSFWKIYCFFFKIIFSLKLFSIFSFKFQIHRIPVHTVKKSSNSEIRLRIQQQQKTTPALNTNSLNEKKDQQNDAKFSKLNFGYRYCVCASVRPSIMSFVPVPVCGPEENNYKNTSTSSSNQSDNSRLQLICWRVFLDDSSILLSIHEFD